MKNKKLMLLLALAGSTVCALSGLTGCGDSGASGDSGNQGATHKHTYEWKYDETHHWRETTCGHEVEDDKKAEHTYSGKACKVCGRYIPPETLELTQGRLVYRWSMVYNGYNVTAVEDKSALTQAAIPSKINGYPVTYIGDYAFKDCSALTNISIPSSVTSIGWSAFSNCCSLTSIIIPDSVAIIMPNAFDGCSSLQFNEYANAKYLGNEKNPYRFLRSAKSTDITACTIHEDTKVICNYAFAGCSALTSIAIPDSVMEVENGAFEGCSSLVSATIGNGLTFIGWYMFIDCISLKSITIPDSVAVIGVSAFRNCSSLETVYYKGTAEEWNEISIDSSNSELTSAARYYYSETEPTEEGNYWHYDSDGVTPVQW